MELLPAERDIRVVQPQSAARRSARCKSTMQPSSFATGNAPRQRSQSCRSAALWQRLYREARQPRPCYVAERTHHAGRHPGRGRIRKKYSVGIRTTDAGRTRLEGAGAARSRTRAARNSGPRRRTQSTAVLEALLAASLAATAPMPVMKSKGTKRSEPAAFTLLNGGSPARCLANGRHRSRQSRRALAHRAATECPQHAAATGKRCAISRAVKAGQFASSTRQRCSGGAPARSSPCRAPIEQRDAGIVRLRYRALAATQARKTPRTGRQRHLFRHRRHQSQDRTRACTTCTTDMQGSAVAVGTLLALSALEAPYDIDCWLAITENEIGARAFRPQEVVRAANGVTIQVAHSDAEGRMVLADTLALAAREKPGSDRRFRDAHRRVRHRADRALQRRVHESAAVARSYRARPAATAASACGRFRWTRTSTATWNLRSPMSCNARRTARAITSSPRAS